MANCEYSCPYFKDKSIKKNCPNPSGIAQEQAIEACARIVSDSISYESEYDVLFRGWEHKTTDPISNLPVIRNARQGIEKQITPELDDIQPGSFEETR